jgi:hypothetical protein
MVRLRPGATGGFSPRTGSRGFTRVLEFGHLEPGFHFVPEGHAIVARLFIAGLAIHRICVPEGRLKLELGCYESGPPDRFKVRISTLPRSERTCLAPVLLRLKDPGVWTFRAIQAEGKARALLTL